MSEVVERAVAQAGATHTHNSALTVHQLEPRIGAEISGIDLRQPLTQAVRDELYQLLLKHRVLFFRDQFITYEQQEAFALNFGPLLEHVTSKKINTEAKVAHQISAQAAREEYDIRFGRWHTDTSWQLTPGLGAVLRAVHLPDVGGDTLWANGAAVYEGLSDELKEKIDDLYIVHDYQKRLAKVDHKYPLVSHPLVLTHPDTGETILFPNFSLNPSIVGWSKEESDKLLAELLIEFNRPEYQVRFKWRPGSVAFWDNRAGLHYAVQNYGDFPRLMERVLIGSDHIPQRVRTPKNV
jgi:alpha-ketoglutarate-dependent taurine dioxygenase